jgi:hypothetical protein
MTEKVDVWNLNPESVYLLEGAEQVVALMRQLRIPNLFASAVEHDTIKALAAFDNHPTHWIVLRLWKGGPAYSPNHRIHRLVKFSDPNGLLFEASPKRTATRQKMESDLKREMLEMESSAPFSWQKLP